MIDWESKLERKLHVDENGDSHTEYDTNTFHPSQISRCKRTCVKSKFGLDEHDTSTLGTFRIGTIIHEWMENSYRGKIDGVEFEHPVQYESDNGIKFVGNCDVYDSHENAIYDFKTRSSWYRFDPPDESHLDQLTVYMAALDADYAQVVYISKKNLEIRTYPEDRLFKFNQDRFRQLVEKADEIRNALDEHGQPETLDEIPFEPCGCWICSQEDTDK